MDEKKLNEKISEIILLLSEAPTEMRFHRIFEIIKEMNLKEMNKLDKKLILTERDFEIVPPENLLAATVTRLNMKKIDLIIEEIFRRGEDREFWSGLHALLGQCFFRKWTLLMAAERLKEKAHETKKKPEVPPRIKATLHFVTALAYTRLGSGDYSSSI